MIMQAVQSPFHWNRRRISEKLIRRYDRHRCRQIFEKTKSGREITDTRVDINNNNIILFIYYINSYRGAPYTRRIFMEPAQGSSGGDELTGSRQNVFWIWAFSREAMRRPRTCLMIFQIRWESRYPGIVLELKSIREDDE